MYHIYHYLDLYHYLNLIHTHTHTHTHTNKHTHTQTHTLTRTHARTHTHTHTDISIDTDGSGGRVTELPGVTKIGSHVTGVSLSTLLYVFSYYYSLHTRLTCHRRVLIYTST